MPLTPQQIALAKDPTRDPDTETDSSLPPEEEHLFNAEPEPPFDHARRHFKEPLCAEDWDQLNDIVRRRLIKAHGEKLVVDGVAFKAVDCVWWDRQPPPNFSEQAQMWPLVLYHDGPFYRPDSFLHHAAYVQFGLPFGTFEHWFDLQRRFTDLHHLGMLYVECQPAPQDAARAAELTAAQDFESSEWEGIIRRSRPPSNPRATAEAVTLVNRCADIIKYLKLAQCTSHDHTHLIKLAFGAGQAFADLMYVRDSLLLKQNKHGKVTGSGASPGEVKKSIVEKIDLFVAKHGRRVSPEELIEFGKIETIVKKGRDYVIFPDGKGRDDHEVLRTTFDRYVAEGNGLYGFKQPRGRPKKK